MLPAPRQSFCLFHLTPDDGVDMVVSELYDGVEAADRGGTIADAEGGLAMSGGRCSSIVPAPHDSPAPGREGRERDSGPCGQQACETKPILGVGGWSMDRGGKKRQTKPISEANLPPEGAAPAYSRTEIWYNEWQWGRFAPL